MRPVPFNFQWQVFSRKFLAFSISLHVTWLYDELGAIFIATRPLLIGLLVSTTSLDNSLVHSSAHPFRCPGRSSVLNSSAAFRGLPIVQALLFCTVKGELSVANFSVNYF